MAVVVSNYNIEDQIGAGSFSTVYKAKCPLYDNDVVIKVPKNQDDVYFKEEILISKYISKINSDYLLKCHSHQYSKYKEKYLVLDYFNGITLEEKLELAGGSIDEDKVKEILRQIALGIKDLHDNNIIHHDIKLENIMCDEDNNVKIIDYGFSRKCTNEFRAWGLNVYGTPIYYAPEIFIKSVYNFKVDIWACGVCFFRLVTGRFPYTAKNLTDLKRNVWTKHTSYPPCISPTLKDLIKKMLRKNKFNRYDIDQVLKHPFFME